MKTGISLCPIQPSFCWRRKPALLAGLLLLAVRLSAQIAVSSITTSTSDQSNQTTDGQVFDRTTTSITQFKDAAGNIYDANTVSGSAYVRRDTTGINSLTGTVNANNSSMWYANGTGTDMSATYATNYASLLLGNNLLRGSDNTFANGTDATSGNIERLDFVFNAAGITASASTSIAVFDRGAIGVHDNVKIAVITGWDSVNNVPTAYGGILASVQPSDYGTANLTSDFNYNLFRYSNGDNLGSPYWTSDTETGTQGIGGRSCPWPTLGSRRAPPSMATPWWPTTRPTGAASPTSWTGTTPPITRRTPTAPPAAAASTSRPSTGCSTTGASPSPRPTGRFSSA